MEALVVVALGLDAIHDAVEGLAPVVVSIGVGAEH
jgi:hypothetical protein